MLFPPSQHSPMQVCSEVSPIGFNRATSQASVPRIAACVNYWWVSVEHVPQTRLIWRVPPEKNVASCTGTKTSCSLGAQFPSSYCEDLFMRSYLSAGSCGIGSESIAAPHREVNQAASREHLQFISGQQQGSWSCLRHRPCKGDLFFLVQLLWLLNEIELLKYSLTQMVK